MEKRNESLMTRNPDDETRREFLKTAGKMAIYTPPAIMLLMKPSREALACASLNVRKFGDRKPQQGPANFKQKKVKSDFRADKKPKRSRVQKYD
jgi:hypothetical protein